MTLALFLKSSTSNTYSTLFSATENPISEGGIWKNGLTDGLDWANVKTVSGNAVGTQIKNAHYNDSTAILNNRVWAANQRAKATVYKSGVTTDTNPEIEIRLRSLLAAHQNRGYEGLFSVTAAYNAQIVRWDGLDDYHIISAESSAPTISDGDTIEMEIIGGHLKLWHNNILITEADDATFTDGNPGIGFYTNTGGDNDHYGFKDFEAWEV